MDQTERNNTTTASATGEVRPVPPRYWWLKRIGVASGVILTALLGLRLWWGAVAHRRLQAAIEEYRAAGERLYPEDFDVEPIPEEENAVVLLQRAMSLLTRPPNSQIDADAILGDPALVRERTEEVARLYEANRPALDLLRAARARPRVDWGVRMRSPMINYVLPSMRGYRTLAKLTCAMALYHVEVGESGEAIEALRDALALADVIRRQPTLISEHVAIAIDGVVARMIEAIAPRLYWEVRGAGEGESAAGGARGADVLRDSGWGAELDAFARECASTELLQRGMVLGVESERALQLDSASALGSGKMSLAWFGGGGTAPTNLAWMRRALWWPAWPLLDLDALAMMRWTTQWRDFAVRLHWHGTDVERPGDPSFRAIWSLTRPLSAVLIPSLERTFFLYFRAVAMRRMAAAALAIRHYELEHGRRPDGLGELVPRYLGSVPDDPFALEGVAIGYLPNAAPPVLYCVGMDGVDDRGAFSLRRRGGRVDWEKLDMPFFLDGDRPGRR